MWLRSLLLIALLLSTLAHGQDAPGVAPRSEDLRDFMSARGYGMGGAWRALGLGAEAGTGNPAALALIRSYRVELTGAWDWVNKDAFGMLAVSDATNPLAAGVSYQLGTIDSGAQRATVHLNTLALALPLMDSILVGVSTRYLLMRGARSADAITGDVGLVIRPSEFFALGVSAHNLLRTPHPELAPYYSAHVGVLTGQFVLGADVRADFETNEQLTLTYSGGLEVLLGQAFPVRAGYTYDGFTRSSQLGFGIGFLSQGGGLDLAYRQDLGGEQGRLLALTLKVQVM
jgi:hypothetical protein